MTDHLRKCHIVQPRRKRETREAPAYHLGNGPGHADGVATGLRRDARPLQQQHTRRQHSVVELPEDPRASVGVGVVAHPDLEGGGWQRSVALRGQETFPSIMTDTYIFFFCPPKSTEGDWALTFPTSARTYSSRFSSSGRYVPSSARTQDIC